MTPHYSETISPAWIKKLAEALVRIERKAPGRFKGPAFIQRYKNHPPEALLATLELLERNIHKVKSPWPYAERTLLDYKAPKASARKAEAAHEEIKRQTGMVSIGQLLRMAMADEEKKDEARNE